MNVYQRPLFRQMGGPVAPGMAAQEAMPPAQDPMMMAQQAQDMAAQQTQGLGAQYAQDTLMNIDRAETPEQIINALRGNEAPMAQRYAELAQFVGEADAQRTPESVLALVQPTIMMTEQGAMDSGIGELMQGLTGEIEMETADGAPTAMGQGVGSLMMAGAPAAPEMGVGQQPVANFRQGGVVQRFQTGGEASRLQQIYAEMLPTYESILGSPDEARRLSQAQILFDIADRAGAFAAGVDPRTGQSMARLSPAAQLAAAASGLGGQIGERMAGVEQQERQLRASALQAAQGEFSAERAAARAAAAAGGSRGIGDAYEAVDADGNVIATEFLATRDQLDAFRAANPNATIRQAREPSTDFDTVTFYGPDGQPVSFLTSTTQGQTDAAAALASGQFTAVPPPAPGEEVLLYNPNNLEAPAVRETVGSATYDLSRNAGLRTLEEIEALRNLTTPEADAPDIRSVQVGTGPVQNFDVSTAEGAEAFRTASEQPGARIVTDSAARTADPLVNPDVMSAYAAGTLPPEEEARVQSLIAENTRSVFNAESGRFEQPTITPLVRQAEEARRAAGLPTVIAFPEDGPAPDGAAERERVLTELGGSAFGTVPFFQELANTAFAFVDANAPFPEAQEGVDAVTALNQDALIAFREATGGRTAQEAVNQFQQILPTPARIAGSPTGAASEIRQVVNLFNAQIETGQRALQTGVASASDRQRIEQGILSAQAMVRAYQALLQGIERAASGSGVDPAQFRR